MHPACRLDGLAAKVAAALAAHAPTRLDDEAGVRRAAVAAVLSDDSDPALLFIRRQVRAGDPWSGQMAFPGGFRAADDEPVLLTARRETLEETGLDLGTSRFLGALDDLSPRTPFLPPLVVTPHVFLVPGRTPVAPGAEADEVLWVAIRDLLDPYNQTAYSVPLPTGTRDFPAIRIDSRVIWGLTERIIRQIADLAGTTF
jgi:8-oxo-dGTP pyrophosphatase MutT (NUDIX family)